MAISHICLACGVDLARVRPFRDPHYALLLVLCPQCGAAAARRKHPSIVLWRRSWRVARTLAAVILQLVIFGGVTALTMVSCMITASHLAAGSLPGPDHWLARAILLGLVVLLSVTVGVWLTIGLSHWRRWVAWTAFFAWLALLMAMDALIVPAVFAAVDRLGVDTLSLPMHPRLWITRLALLAAMMTAALTGISIGTALRHGWRAVVRQRWRARRRRLRRRRTT